MPSTVKVRINAARDLPPLQHVKLSADAYVSFTLGGHSEFISDIEDMSPSSNMFKLGKSAPKRKCYKDKTSVVRRSLNPEWKEEFRLDVADDTLLQDEPLIFTVYDADAISTGDGAIGSVYIDLNPLLMRSVFEDNDSNEKDHLEIDGWFPIFCPLEGVRGELCLSIKLNFIGDINPFRDSSAGVQLFPFSSFDQHSSFQIRHVFGFVEELVVSEDVHGEFEFTGNFRLARQGHERRQTLMYLLDASVRRRMCKKVLEMGGNAVMGYYQSFDMEGDSLVARVFGTCVLVERTDKKSNLQFLRNAQLSGKESDAGEDSDRIDENENISGAMKNDMTMATRAAKKYKESSQGEVQLLTLKEFGPRVRVRIGGLVTARSVKYLGKLASKLSDQETRDGWWSELRDEIKSHAKTLGCSHVIGYSEASTIHDDVCVLSISGTAATVRGLPDLTKEHEVWIELERRVLNGNSNSFWSRKRHQRLLTGSPNPSATTGYINTPTANEEDEEDDEEIGPEISNTMSGQLVIREEILEQQEPLSKKVMRRQKHEKRLEKRYMKAVKRSQNKEMFSNRSLTQRNKIMRARLARPCSYCHVPYHQ